MKNPLFWMKRPSREGGLNCYPTDRLWGPETNMNRSFLVNVKTRKGKVMRVVRVGSFLFLFHSFVGGVYERLHELQLGSVRHVRY